MTEADIERLRTSYEAFNRGDFEEAAASIAPDAAIHDRPESPDATSYAGRDAVLAQFQRVRDEFNDYRIEVVELSVEASSIVAHVRQSGIGKLSGVPVEGELFHVWEIDDGRVLSMHAFTTREEAVAAAVSP